jgi:hypothetical protein
VTAKRSPNTKYAKGNVRRHHHPIAGFLHLLKELTPWAIAGSLAWYVATHQDRDELDAFCSTAGIVPDRFLCTDMLRCDDYTYWASVGAKSMNLQTRLACPEVHQEVAMYIPQDAIYLSDEARAEIEAEISALQAWQRDRVIREATAGMGGPE